MAFENFRHNPDLPIAFTDLETGGFSPARDALLEIGAVITTPDLEIIEEINIKVKPLPGKNISRHSIIVNGYNEEDWENAVSLEEGLALFNDAAVNATLIGHHSSFDDDFLDQAFADTKMLKILSEYRICNRDFARVALRDVKMSYEQKAVAVHFGLKPEPAIHRAANGAHLARQIYGKLIELADQQS